MPAARALLAASFVAFAAATAGADILQLKDGRIVDGVKMQKEKDAVLVFFKNGIVRVPMEVVEDVLIEGAPPPDPVTEEEKVKRAQGLAPWKGKWIQVAARDKELKKELAAREKAIAEYRKHKEWRNRYQFKSKNFEFESNLPQAINDDYAEILETFFREFGKLWKVQVPKDWGRLRICFYATAEDFIRTGGVQGAYAYYRFVAPRELNFYYDRYDVPFSISCLYHEASHYLTDLVASVNGFQYPHWVNESLAEYYGAAVWDSEKKTMTMGGLQHGRLEDVRSDRAQEKPYGLRRLLTSMRGDYEHYTWGWTFTHLMMESPKYRQKFMKFYWDLSHASDVRRKPGGMGFTYVESGDEILRVFLARMGLKETDLDALEKEWYAHIDAMDTSSLRGLEEAGKRAYRENKWRFKAPRLLKAAIDKGSRKPEVWSSYARCLYLKGDEASRAEAAKVMEKACEVDPLYASLWAERGYLTYAAGNKEEGQRMLALAEEMDPEGDFYSLEGFLMILSSVGSGE